ncbi:MAG: UbiA-like polyprenyltransferase [Flavobacteriales bacterium]
MSATISGIQRYFSLIKFSHTIFALPFAMVGFFMAVHFNETQLEWMLLLKVILCMVFARSAAMAFNRYLDRDIDAKNKRTAIREIPSGKISPDSALLFVIANSAAFITVTYFINALCFALSPIALTVILGYSFTKRFTALCHFVLGLGLSLAPIGAYLAVTGKFDAMPLLISFAVLFWVSGFDIIYALQDDEFDRSQELNSIPVLLGRTSALTLSRFMHLCAVLFIAAAGFYGDLGVLYWTGTAIFAALLVYQQSLVRPNDLSKVNLAFFTTNGIASVLFAAFVLADFFI